MSAQPRNGPLGITQSLLLIFGIILANVLFISIDKFSEKRSGIAKSKKAEDWACSASIIFGIGLYFQGSGFFFDRDVSTRGFMIYHLFLRLTPI